MQAEFLQNFFSIEREPFMLVVGIFGPRKLHQFDFLKLMLTNDAAHVLAIRPRFAAKAGSVSRERNRKPRRVKDLVAVQVRDRDFRRWNEPQIFVSVRDSKQVCSELGKVPRTIHRVGVHQVRRQHFCIPMLARVEIKHEVRQSTLQLCPKIPVNRESCARKLDRALQIEHA